MRVPLKLGLLPFWVLHATGSAGNDRNCSIDIRSRPFFMAGTALCTGALGSLPASEPSMSNCDNVKYLQMLSVNLGDKTAPE